MAVSAFAYPLGNRGLLLHLERAGIELGATQRVFGMTLTSQPLWIAVSIAAFAVAGPPSASQVALAAGVALSAGVVATVLFSRRPAWCARSPPRWPQPRRCRPELLFATAIGAPWLGEAWPRGGALAGALLVVAGIVATSLAAARAAKA